MLPILIVHYFFKCEYFLKKIQKYVTEAWNFCLILIVSYFVTISEHSSIINDVPNPRASSLNQSLNIVGCPCRSWPTTVSFIFIPNTSCFPELFQETPDCEIAGRISPRKVPPELSRVTTTDFVAKYASTIFNLSCTVYRVVGSIDALGWKSKALSMIYLKMREIC